MTRKVAVTGRLSTIGLGILTVADSYCQAVVKMVRNLLLEPVFYATYRLTFQIDIVESIIISGNWSSAIIVIIDSNNFVI